MNAVAIRWMEPEERGSVRALGRRAFPPFMGAMLSLTLSSRVLVAEDESGRLVGGLDLKVFRAAGQKIGVVNWIFTAPESLGLGVGKALLNAALDWFRQEKCDQVVTTGVDGYNSRSYNLFEGQGFRRWRFLEQVREMGWHWPLMIVAGTFHFADVGAFLLRKRLDERPLPEEKPGRGLGALAATTLMLWLLLVVSLIRQRMWETLDPAQLLHVASPVLIATSAAVVVAYVVVRAAGHLIAARALGVPLEFRPWESGLTLATILALAFGAFFPSGGGSFYVRQRGFRYTEARPMIGKIALAGVIPSLLLLAAFTVLSEHLTFAWVGRFAGLPLGFFDTLLFFSPFEPLPAGHLWRWNRAVWLAVALCFLAIWLILPGAV